MIHRANETVVILGTSRSDGNTRLLLEYVINSRSIRIIDLSTISMSYYDYAHSNSSDSFLPLIESLLEKSLWLFATPVYWYAMSAQMKTFFDRLNDLITIRKDLGRKLRGKSAAVIACGTEPQLPEGFEVPFRLTCEYLGMQYLSTHYSQFEKSNIPISGVQSRATAFGASLFDMPANPALNADSPNNGAPVS